MSDTTYTRDQVDAAIMHGTNLVDTIADSAAPYDLCAGTTARLGDGPAWTRKQVSQALNDAANALPDFGYEDSETIWITDVLNLPVNAVGYVLEHPGAGLF